MKAVAALGLATLLFACFGNTPAAVPSDQELKNDAVKSYVQTDTAVELEINDALLASSLGIRAQGVTDSIDALLAKLIVVLPGGVSNQPLQPVTVANVCAGRYALNNPNAENLVLTWKSSDGVQRGSFVAAANSVTAFEAQGLTVSIFAKNSQVASIASENYSDNACTETLPIVPGAMTLQVYKLGNKIRVELPASLLPGQRFTLFFNLYPPFAISLVRIQTPAEANKQVALQNAWGLVKEDPRVKDLGLNLDTANLQGEQRNGATLVLIPEKDLGYIQLITRGQEVLLLERWVFFSDTTFTMWNMLNGRRVDFAEAATYAGMKTDLSKRNLFKNLYATVYAQPEGTVIRTGAVQRLTPGCDGCEDLYNKLLNSVSEEINARGDLGTDIKDIIIDCVVGAASELSIKGCLNRDALFGIVRSFGNFESFTSWLRATTDVDDLKRKLVDCTALKVTDKLCFGNIQLSPVDSKVDGIVGIPNEISYSVFNRAKYSRYINIYTPTSSIPIQTIYARGSNDYNLFAGYTCLAPGSFQKQIIARTVVDKPNQTQYSDQRDFTLSCASLPSIDLRTSANQIDSGGLKGLTGRFQPNGTFKGQGIVSRGFSWDFTDFLQCDVNAVPHAITAAFNFIT